MCLCGRMQSRVRFLPWIHQNLVSFKFLCIYCDTDTQPFRLDILGFKTPNMVHTGYTTQCWPHLFQFRIDKWVAKVFGMTFDVRTSWLKCKVDNISLITPPKAKKIPWIHTCWCDKRREGKWDCGRWFEYGGGDWWTSRWSKNCEGKEGEGEDGEEFWKGKERERKQEVTVTQLKVQLRRIVGCVMM